MLDHLTSGIQASPFQVRWTIEIGTYATAMAFVDDFTEGGEGAAYYTRELLRDKVTVSPVRRKLHSWLL